jgi:plastocyanin
MRSPGRFLWLVALLAFTGATLPSIASSATTATVNAISAGIYPYWNPEQVAVTTSGGTVTFINSSASVPHGIVWKSTPATPSCQEGAGQVPVGTTKWGYSWKGDCTFTQEGVYRYYCAYHGEAMSGAVYVNASGTIPPPPPTAITQAASAPSETGATLNGSVTPNGQATEYFFKYGPTTSYGTETTPHSAGAGSTSVSVSASAVGLSPGTTYHFELVATYASGTSTVLGGDRTFRTLSPPGAPIAETGPASAVSDTAATLKGTVNPNGQATEYIFEWGLTDSYGQITAILPAGEDHATHAESAALTGLTPETVYHFRIVAMNASGPAPGVDSEFTTASSPPPTSEVTPPATTPVISALPFKPQEVVPSGPPLTGSSLKLTVPRHGFSVRGSIDVAQSGAGGRLEIDLLAKSALLTKVRGSSKSVRVGRLVRQSVSPGKLSFSVALTAQGKRALHHRHSLPVTVEITLDPDQGVAMTLTRSVTLRS